MTGAQRHHPHWTDDPGRLPSQAVGVMPPASSGLPGGSFDLDSQEHQQDAIPDRPQGPNGRRLQSADSSASSFPWSDRVVRSRRTGTARRSVPSGRPRRRRTVHPAGELPAGRAACAVGVCDGISTDDVNRCQPAARDGRVDPGRRDRVPGCRTPALGRTRRPRRVVAVAAGLQPGLLRRATRPGRVDRHTGGRPAGRAVRHRRSGVGGRRGRRRGYCGRASYPVLAGRRVRRVVDGQPGDLRHGQGGH